MPKIASVMDILGKLESIDITVHQERCAVVRNRNSRCTKCADACTSGAISIEDNELIITPDLCIGCGTCATVCPTCALEAQHPNDAELIQFAAKIMSESESGAVPVFACHRVIEANKDTFDRRRVIEVACLGRLDESLLTAIVSMGSPDITLVKGDCENCPNGTGLATTHLVLDTMDTLLASWGQESRIKLIDQLPEEVKLSEKAAKGTESFDGLSRRDFFTQIKTGAQTAVADAAATVILAEERAEVEVPRYAKVQKDGSLPHFIPNRRERLLDNLDRIGEPIVETIDTRLWGHVEIDENLCTSCRMCATFCPTGAISKFDDRDGTFGIEHYPTDCVHCNLCMDICVPGALTLGSEVPVKELVEGVIERHVMTPVKNEPGKPDSIYRSMFDLLGGGQIYER